MQNRPFVNWGALDEKNKKFLKEFYEKITATMALRDDPRLKPLNTGTPYALALHGDELSDNKTKVSGILRQNSPCLEYCSL